MILNICLNNHIGSFLLCPALLESYATTKKWTADVCSGTEPVDSAIHLMAACASLSPAAVDLPDCMTTDSPPKQVAPPNPDDAKKQFALRATGDSMAGGADPIHDGDWVIFRHARYITL